MRKRNVALVITVVAVLLVGAALTAWAEQETVTVPIGILMPLSGDFASYGARGKAVVEKAQQDIQEFTETAGLPIKFEFYYEDTETKADIALEKLKTFAAKGVSVVTGLIDSGQTRLIKGYADANKIVVITPFSTVANLGMANDYIFRLIPHDDMEGIALAKLVYNRGYEHVAMLVRKDPCDMSISTRFQSEYAAAGGDVLTVVEFAGGTREFSSEVAALERAIGPAIDKYGADKVAIVSLTWEDLALIYAQAEARNSIALSVTWTGGDAVAHSSVLLKDAGQTALRVSTISPMYTVPSSPKKEAVVEFVQEKLGEEPDIYSLITYDCVWVAALSVLAAGGADGELIGKALPFVAANYYGASGVTELDAAGDRRALDVDFWAVTTVDGTPTWQKVAEFSAATGVVTWLGSK